MQVEGKVKKVDQAANRVTLDDGTQLTIPASVRVDWKTLKPGSGSHDRQDSNRELGVGLVDDRRKPARASGL
jgi:hypothetical protein